MRAKWPCPADLNHCLDKCACAVAAHHLRFVHDQTLVPATLMSVTLSLRGMHTLLGDRPRYQCTRGYGYNTSKLDVICLKAGRALPSGDACADVAAGLMSHDIHPVIQHQEAPA